MRRICRSDDKIADDVGVNLDKQQLMRQLKAGESVLTRVRREKNYLQDANTKLFFLNANTFVSLLIFTLVAAMMGFLPYNFFPARIYLGDTGSLFIGFMTAVFSLFGLKNVTLISVGVPVMILGVPITDTIYAMIRRILNKKPISQADKHHLHHRLMQLGLTHRQTVMVIYGIALIFSFISLLYPISSLGGSILLTIGLLFGLELFVEAIGLAGDNRQPLLKWIKRTVAKFTSKSNH